MFDCGTCVFRQQVDGLDADNLEAWAMYGRIQSHRWIWDAQCGPWWIGTLFDGLEPEDRDELMDRVSIIYDTLHPPKAKAHGA